MFPLMSLKQQFFLLGVACVDPSLSLLRIASLLNVQQSIPDVGRILAITCMQSIAMYLLHIWQQLCYTFGQHLQHDCSTMNPRGLSTITFYNAFPTSNGKYQIYLARMHQGILYIYNMFVVYLQRKFI